MTALKQFEASANHHMAIVMFWRDWGGSKSALDTNLLSAIRAHGSVPMITWSPADWDSGSNQTPYTLANIAAGADDSYLRGWADQLKAYGGPVLIRTMHEMNGNWYPWSGNAAAYVAAWRHIHDVFMLAGATNVQWVWSPNVWWTGSLTTEPSAYYPGDGYVDWVGLDGYNKPSGGWMTFNQIFSYSYTHITSLSSKPLMLAESSSGEATSTQAAAGDSKATWITDTFASTLPLMPRVRAFVWFNEDKTVAEGCCNWQTNSSTPAQSAYSQAVQAPQYAGYWP